MSFMREEAKAYIERKWTADRLRVNLPPTLFNAIKASAKVNHRSLNAEIVYQLVEAYERKTQPSNIEQIMRLR